MQTEFDLIIIGSGHAGYQLAQEFRRLEQKKSIAIVTEDDGAFYSKPAISTALSKKQLPEKLITKPAQDMATQLDATLLTHTQVIAIDKVTKSITTTDDELTYGNLVLATGATPREINSISIDNKRCHHINNLEHYRNFRENIQQGDTVTIVGTGLVGTEFANDLVSSGYQVHLVGRDDRIMQNLVPKEVGDAIGNVLTENGVKRHMHCNVDKVEQTPQGQLQVFLDNKEIISSDILIAALGLIPNTKLAAQAGLACEQGIVTNQYLQTSDENIYAIGDAANVCGLNLQYIMPLNLCAKVIAKNLTGEATTIRYPAMPIIVKTTLLPTVVAPPMTKDINWQIEQDGNHVKAIARDAQQKIKGFAVTGRFLRERFPLTKQLPSWLE